MNNNDKVKQLLFDNNYYLNVILHNESDITFYFSFYDNVITYKIDREQNKIERSVFGGELEVFEKIPDYAIASFVYFDIMRIAKMSNFDPSLVDFYEGETIITKNVFLDKILVNWEFHRLIEEANNKYLPFHFSFEYRAEQMGFLPGYNILSLLRPRIF